MSQTLSALSTPPGLPHAPAHHLHTGAGTAVTSGGGYLASAASAQQKAGSADSKAIHAAKGLV